MEKKFYTVKDVVNITGYSKSKAYDIIRKMNTEIKEKQYSQNEKTLILPGRINKEYFDKKIAVNV